MTKDIEIEPSTSEISDIYVDKPIIPPEAREKNKGQTLQCPMMTLKLIMMPILLSLI